MKYPVEMHAGSRFLFNRGILSIESPHMGARQVPLCKQLAFDWCSVHMLLMIFMFPNVDRSPPKKNRAQQLMQSKRGTEHVPMTVVQSGPCSIAVWVRFGCGTVRAAPALRLRQFLWGKGCSLFQHCLADWYGSGPSIARF